jgi:DNA-binding XRE family transcriptional regulator
MRNAIGRILYARNLREHDLARRAGLTQSHLNRIKNDRVDPSLETALRICRALGLRVEDVFHPGAAADHPRRPRRAHTQRTRAAQDATCAPGPRRRK